MAERCCLHCSNPEVTVKVTILSTNEVQYFCDACIMEIEHEMDGNPDIQREVVED